MNWTEFLLAEAESAYGTTAGLMDWVDDETLGWRPETGSNWMTMGQLLKHLSNGCGAGCKGFVLGDWGLPPGKRIEDLSPEEMTPPAEALPFITSVDEAQLLLIADREQARAMIMKAGSEGLMDCMLEAPWSPDVRLPLGLWLFRMIQHLERHKSQLFFYLKLQGKPVGTAQLWGRS